MSKLKKSRSAKDEVAAFKSDVEQISHAHRPYENFVNFLEAAYCAIAKRNCGDEKRAELLKQRYMRVVGKYSREPEAMMRMSHVLGSLTMTIPNYPGDFLGEAYMGAGFGNERAGQFFTPFAICSLMARINFDEDQLARIKAEGRPVTVSDPACGAGAQILAVADCLTEGGLDVAQYLLATLVDIDSICFQMSYLQMTLKGIPAICIHGNSLTLEECERAFTPAAIRLLNRSPELLGRRQAQQGTTPGTQAEDDEVGARDLTANLDVEARSEAPDRATSGSANSPVPRYEPSAVEATQLAPKPLTLELFPSSEASPVGSQRPRPVEVQPQIRVVTSSRDLRAARAGGSRNVGGAPEHAGQIADLFASKLQNDESVSQSKEESQAGTTQLTSQTLHAEQVGTDLESVGQGADPTPRLGKPNLTRIHLPLVRRPSLRRRR